MDKHYCKAARDCGCTFWNYGEASRLCADLNCLDYVLPEPITNADRIRDMDDKEMAKYFAKTFCHGYGQPQLLDWLQQPAPEEGVQNV